MSLPPLIWSTHKLADGWVLLCVDASLELPGEPEALLGYRRAVHPFDFDEAEVHTLSASRARAFGG